jgi:hypothetical protein
MRNKDDGNETRIMSDEVERSMDNTLVLISRILKKMNGLLEHENMEWN